MGSIIIIMNPYLEVSVHPEDGVALLVHREVHRAHDRVGDDGAPVGAVQVAPLDPGLGCYSVMLCSNIQLKNYCKISEVFL